MRSKSKSKSGSKLKKDQKKSNYVNVLSILTNVLYVVFIISSIRSMIRPRSSGVVDFGGALIKDINTIGLDNMRGLDESELKIAKNIKKMNLNYLFVGPPGTGKTEIVKSIAKYNNIPLYTLNGTESGIVSVTENNIRRLYNRIKENGGGIIFIDELERFCAKRQSASGGGGTYHNDVTSYILQIIHETVKDNIIWLAACNDIDLIDDAIVNRFNVVNMTNLTDDEKIKLAEYNIGNMILKDKTVSIEAKDAIINHIKNLGNRDIVKFLTKLNGYCSVNNVKNINENIVNVVIKSRFYGSVKRKRSVKRSSKRKK